MSSNNVAHSKPKIVIVGAGLQGLCVALALSKHGLDCTVLERRPEPIRGASYGNEGKIHLGFVYALDSSLRTGIEMLRGALSFSPLLDEWCGPLPWHEWKSAGFRYAVMPGSMAALPALETYYENLRLLLPRVVSDLPIKSSYFGETLGWMWKSATTTSGSPLNKGIPVASIDTEEVALDTNLFSDALVEIIRLRNGITLRCNTRVAAAERLVSGFGLVLEKPEGTERMVADVVINCAWTDRIRLDRMVDAASQDTPLSYRVKHRIVVRPQHGTRNLMPVTMVQGPYGDVVPYKDGSVYLSWYPACRTYFDKKPPAQEIHAPSALDAIAKRTLNEMSNMFPDLANAQILSCSPCVIVAEGTRDVDDPDSELHRRSDSGPRGGNGWWSVDTGKLTLAPLHGEATAQLVLEELGLGP